MVEVAAVVLHSAEPERAVEFYRALGLTLEPEEHDEGPAHFAVEAAGVHVAIYSADAVGRAPARRSAGSVFLGFYVESLAAATDELHSQGFLQLGGHEQMPWGCRVVFEDPDGRAVEINQRSHCRSAADSA